MGAPYTQNNAIRDHDLAVMNWLKGLHVDYGTIFGAARNDVSIISVQAAPDRAFADVPKTLVETGWITGATANDMASNAKNLMEVLPLPIASVWATDPVSDPEMAGVPKRIQVGAKKVQYPGHYKRDYTINFWCRKQYTDSHIREWVMSQMGPVGCAANERLIPVDHHGYGIWNQQWKMAGSADLTEIEGPNPTYRRIEYTFSMRFWLMRPLA